MYMYLYLFEQNNLAVVMLKLGDIFSAETYFREILKVHKEHLLTPDIDLIQITMSLAECLHNREEWKECIELYTHCFHVLENSKGVSHAGKLVGSTASTEITTSCLLSKLDERISFC